MSSIYKKIGILLVFVFVQPVFGNDVTKMIQQELYEMKCQPGTPDGVWGKKTDEAYNALMADSGQSAKSCGESCGAEILAQLIGLNGADAECKQREPATNAAFTKAQNTIKKAIESCGEFVGTQKTSDSVYTRQKKNEYIADVYSFSMKTTTLRKRIRTDTQKTYTANFNEVRKTDFKNILEVRIGKDQGMDSVYLRARPGFQVTYTDGKKDRRAEAYFHFCDEATAKIVKNAFIDLANNAP